MYGVILATALAAPANHLLEAQAALALSRAPAGNPKTIPVKRIKSCHCSPDCVCGCNGGGVCGCQVTTTATNPWAGPPVISIATPTLPSHVYAQPPLHFNVGYRGSGWAGGSCSGGG